MKNSKENHSLTIDSETKIIILKISRIEIMIIKDQ